jgi:iron complex transport system substrate-binding protein
MKFFLPFILFVLFICFSCKNKEKEPYGVKNNIVQYAKHFRITENKSITKIELLSPETGQIEQTINLAKESADSKKVILVPVKSMAVLSSTHVGMLSILKEVDKIVGITDKQYVFNPRLMENIENGKVLELGEEGQIPVESIIKSKSKVIIYSGFGNDFPHEGQLRNVGVECIVNYDWREIHPLGKAEWILLFGYLTGKEKEAKTYFKKIEKEYLALKKEAKKLKSFPTVLSGNLVGETWFAPAGESFNAVILKDAHVKYRYAHTLGTGSIALTMERILTDNQDTEFWINPGMPTKASLFGFQAKLKLLGPVSKNPIYDFSRSGNRYWEMSAIEPHKVLSDYLHIFHPKEFPKQKFHFYQEVK